MKCSFAGCTTDATYYIRLEPVCKKHYSRWARRTGRWNSSTPVPETLPPCEVVERGQAQPCGQPSMNHTTHVCRMHDMRMRRTGSYDLAEKPSGCRVCGGTIKAGELCHRHDMQQRRGKLQV